MATTEVDFSGWIEEAFDLYKKNFAVLVVAALLVVVLGSVTLGILSGPLLVGLNLIALRLIDGDQTKPEIGDVFKGFPYFVPAFLFFLVWVIIVFIAIAILSVVPCLGNVLAGILPFVVCAVLVFAPFLIHERNLDFWTASMTSIRKVSENPGPLFGVGLIAVVLAGLGGVLCVIGSALTLPFYSLIIGIAYRRLFDQQPTGPSDEAGAPTAAQSETAAPPPPSPVTPDKPAQPADDTKASGGQADERAESEDSDDTTAR